MKLESLLHYLGFDKCIVRCIQKVDKEIISHIGFDINSYMKEKMSYAIGKEIAKKDDVFNFHDVEDKFENGWRGYSSEVFIFSRKELDDLIKKIQDVKIR